MYSGTVALFRNVCIPEKHAWVCFHSAHLYLSIPSSFSLNTALSHFHNYSCKSFPGRNPQSAVQKHQVDVRVCLGYRHVFVTETQHKEIITKRWKWNVLHVPVACCGWRWWDGTDGSQFGSHTLSSPSSAQAHSLHPGLSSTPAEEVRHLLPDSEPQHTKHAQSHAHARRGRELQHKKKTCLRLPLTLFTHPPPTVGGPPFCSQVLNSLLWLTLSVAGTMLQLQGRTLKHIMHTL